MIEPTLEAALGRIAAIRPDDYARTRNSLDGAVTGLSPYITHGVVTLVDILAAVDARRPLPVQHKLVFELGWRAYFRHVWHHRGDGIFRSLHEGPLPDDAYASELPADIREARTGVPVIDRAVHTLYSTGVLHNHARMWLASYLVHLRKVHWRAGADWMIGHLLDGDLASNHLSWQWVAGTASAKPYLFNADNVARFAPTAWHSPGSVVDVSYETLERIAHGKAAVDRLAMMPMPDVAACEEPECHAEPPQGSGWTAPQPGLVAGHDVWLVHPWNLGELPADLPESTRVIGIAVAEFHRRWPWNTHRWHFVGTRMAAVTPQRWYADADAIGAALAGARRIRTVDEPHLRPWLSRWAECLEATDPFARVYRRCDSFSRWWTLVTRGIAMAAELPGPDRARPG